MRISLTILLLGLSTLVGRPAAADDLCGATIVANLTLTEDLTCSGNGLLVGADGITLDLNGHTIMGPGTAVGITVSGRTSVAIIGGTVRNFEAGIRTFDSTRIVIKATQFRENSDGIDLQAGSRRNIIKENQFWDNRTRGIMVRGNVTENMIQENIFSGNRVGVLIFAGVNNTLKENILTASLLAGIRINVLATGNLIVENAITSNPAGVEFLITPTGSATGNVLIENTIAFNTCGIKGPTAANSFRENVFEGNGTDSCF